MLIKTSIKGDSNGYYTHAGKGILYYHKLIIDKSIHNSITFYDHSTSQDRQMMNFMIKTDALSSVLIYYYGITAIPNYNPQVQSAGTNFVLSDVSNSLLNDCGILTYIDDSKCITCTCYGCTNATNCGETCQNNCLSCLSSNIDGCFICKSGFKLLNGICLDNCPFLYNTINNLCIYTSEGFVAEWNFNSFNYPIVTQGISMELPDEGGFQYKRGWYTKRIKVNGNLMLSPIFTIQAWIKLEDDIEFFTKRNNLNEVELKITIKSSDIDVQINTFRTNQTKTLNENFDKEIWKSFIFDVIIKSQVLTLKINSKSASYNSLDFFKSTLNNNSFIGDGKSYFWIYKFILDQHLFNWYNDYSSPSNPNLSFIWNCDSKYYLDGSTCKPCDTSCDTCRFSSNCSLCTNELCSQCDLDSGNTCTLCKESFLLKNNACVCPVNTFLMDSYCYPCKNSLCKLCK